MDYWLAEVSQGQWIISQWYHTGKKLWEEEWRESLRKGQTCELLMETIRRGGKKGNSESASGPLIDSSCMSGSTVKASCIFSILQMVSPFSCICLSGIAVLKQFVKHRVRINQNAQNAGSSHQQWHSPSPSTRGWFTRFYWQNLFNRVHLCTKWGP